MTHIPVLLKEVIQYLDPKPGEKFIDCTINGAGHAMAILDRIKPDGKLLGIEWDGEIAKNLKHRIESEGLGKYLTVVNDSYVNLLEIAGAEGFNGADGILFDLGVSSWHLDEAGRGFTFQKDEPLDMRFSGGTTAGEILNNYSEKEIADIIYNYGEERFSRSIARKIVAERKEKPITTTFQLIEIIKNAVPFHYRFGRLHYATRTFQALRIAVNHELDNVKEGLEQSVKVLKVGGKIAVISFHSLEDRIVKNYFRELAKSGHLKLIVKKPIVAELPEVTENPRARSAKLRIAEKLQ